MSVLKTRRRQYLSQDERRRALLEAALSAFSEHGYHATHVSHIVKEAGVARGTFYLHFESKHAVFEALIEQMLEIFLESRPEHWEPDFSSFVAAEKALSQSYRAILNTFRTHRRLCRLLFEEAIGLEQGFAERLAQHFAVWHRRVKTTLERLISEGLARRDLDTEVSAELVLGMVERLARRYLFAEAEPDLERLVKALVHFELSGVRPLPAAGR